MANLPPGSAPSEFWSAGGAARYGTRNLLPEVSAHAAEATRSGLGHCAPCILRSLSPSRALFAMNSLLRRASSSKPKATRHTVSISRSEGLLGLGLSDDNCVTSITPDSPAANADVLVGDYVVGFGGKPVGRKLVSLLAENTASQIELEIERAYAESKGSSTPRGSSMPRFGSSLFAGMSRRRSSGIIQNSDAAADEVTHSTGSFAHAGETVRALHPNPNLHPFTPPSP